MEISNNDAETKQIGAKIAQKVLGGGIVALYGDLGAGKTTLAKGFSGELGVDESKIKSPTYTYMRRHGNFYHIDLYRIEEIDELLLMEMEEIWQNPNNILLIEWADKLKEHLPQERIDVKIRPQDANTRQIEIYDRR